MDITVPRIHERFRDLSNNGSLLGPGSMKEMLINTCVFRVTLAHMILIIKNNLGQNSFQPIGY